jgi:hypothetical protein
MEMGLSECLWMTNVPIVFRVSTDFRRHGIPSVFLLPSILYSVRNWLKFWRNSAEFRDVQFRGISRNSVTFFMYGIPYISKKTHIKVPNRTGYPTSTTYCTLHDKFLALKIEIQYNLFSFLNFFKGGIWNLDHLVTWGIPYANTYGIPVNFTANPRNSVCFSKNSVFRRKSKTHFRGHPNCIVK